MSIQKGIHIIVSGLVGLLCSASVTADTLLFPVIAVNTPNVITLVTVVNGNVPAPRLRYTYRAKPTLVAGAPNWSGTCDTVQFSRNTYSNDVVTFDVSGTLNGGNALFSDSDVYGGSFELSGSGPQRAYLLVTHANAAGAPLATGNNVALAGEAVFLNVASGSAWGVRAINDRSRENYEFRNFTIAGGGVYSALPNLDPVKRFPFFPLDDWTTRFFVTPIGPAMDSANLQAIALLTGNVYDRSSTPYVLPLINPTVTCTGAIDLDDLMDAATAAAVATSGGWATMATVSPAPASGSVVYKLEARLDDPSFGGSVNNGYLFSGIGTP
jgi:hypothetical protein